MTAAVKGKTRAEAERCSSSSTSWSRASCAEAEQKALGSLRAFAGVAKFPLRVKCASLAWHALHAALRRRRRRDERSGSQGEGA